MVNHPNRRKASKLTPKQVDFLAAAITDSGKILRTNYLFSSNGWLVGANRFADITGELLRRRHLIERVVCAGTNNTLNDGNFFVYRITDAGREALAASGKGTAP